MTLAGQANLAPTETVIGIDALTAEIPDAAVALTAPATITIRNGTTEIGRLELKTGDGSLSLVGRSGATLDLDARLDRVPAALANPFVAGLDAAGTFTGSARVTGSPAAPEAVFDLRAENLATSQTRAANLPALQAVVAGNYASNILTLRTADLDVGDGSLSASGRVGQTILDLQLSLDRLPVALANDFVSGLGASGEISGTATATGTPAEPRAAFTLTGTGITAREVAKAGIAPIELDAAGRYEARLLTLERARATVGAGSLTASGTVGDTLNVDVALTDIPVGLANAFVSDLDATGTISGTARATGLSAPRTPISTSMAAASAPGASPTAAFRRSTFASPAGWWKARQIFRRPSPISARPRSRRRGRSARCSTSRSGRTKFPSASPTASCPTSRHPARSPARQRRPERCPPRMRSSTSPAAASQNGASPGVACRRPSFASPDDTNPAPRRSRPPPRRSGTRRSPPPARSESASTST